MSIAVDDPGPTAPDPEEQTTLRGAIDQFRHDAAMPGVPAAYIRVLRNGTAGVSYPITVAGRPVIIVPAHRSHTAADPAREHQSWIDLRDAITAVTANGCDTDHPALPLELATVVLHDCGHEIRLCQPDTAPQLRRARQHIRRRLTALSPLPFLSALAQPIAGSATAVGIAVTPVLPPVHQTPAPSSPIVREMTGQLAYPLPPWLPGEHPTHPATSTAPLLPAQPPAAVDSLPSLSIAPTRTTARRTPAPSKPGRANTPDPTPKPTKHEAPATTTASEQPAPAAAASPTSQPSKRVHRPGKRHKQPSLHRRR